MTENKKIKMLYDATVLPSYLYKNKNRSGILFVCMNLLREFAKNEDVEITLFYEYHTYKELVELATSGALPENCKMLNVNDIVPPYIVSVIDFLYDLRKKYPKGDTNDNIFKKVLRFFIARSFRLLYKYALPLSDFKKTAKNYNVFFSPCNNLHPLVLSMKNLNPYLLIYDLIPLKMKSFYKDFKKQIEGMERIALSIDNKNTYFAISENTKKDIIEFRKGINPDNIIVAPLAADSKFYRESDCSVINRVKEKYGIPENKKYIFSLCTLEPRKNLIFAIKNFLKFIKKNNINDFIFVLGGAAWQNFPEVLENELQNFESSKDLIKTIGYVEDNDVAVLYSGAEMFVYPTLYEGFGLPVLEAMQCGCPVITSNTSSIPEVIGDAGIMINPLSDEEMVRALEKMYFEQEFRTDCIKRGLERSKLFYWEKTANIIIEKLKKDLNNETVG